MPGIRRVGASKTFRYFGPNGRLIRAEETLARIRSLAVPPAWTDVWICQIEEGHLQAVGRDARHRKQYRYHPRWRHILRRSCDDCVISQVTNCFSMWTNSENADRSVRSTSMNTSG